MSTRLKALLALSALVSQLGPPWGARAWAAPAAAPPPPAAPPAAAPPADMSAPPPADAAASAPPSGGAGGFQGQIPPSTLSDAEWQKKTSSGSVPEKYQIVMGDTLWGISKKFFGEGMAWPRLYEQNKDTISNPNLIYPNKWVVFIPGTGTTLPKLADQAPPADAANASAAPDGGGPTAEKPQAAEPPPSTDKVKSSSARSEEWKLLPRQSWEVTPATLPSTTDKFGFDRSNNFHFSKPKGFDLDAIAATDRVTSLGQIIGGRTGAEYLSLGDTVYIRADEDIQLGETYAITTEPAVLKSRLSDRQGYGYSLLGKVKIIGVRDDLFVGTIVVSRDLISRGSEIIVNPAKVPELAPVAAATAIEGTVILNKTSASFLTAQHKLIFVDRGSLDGVKIGNIFRAYEHYDLSNDRKITSSDFIIDADAMVVYVSDRFCVAMVINSIVPVTENSSAVLLTDISDLGSKQGFRPAGGPKDKQAGDQELDELDKLDDGSGMGKDEQKELQQLEKWKGNPAAAPGQPAPGAVPGTPPSDDSATPPPPPPPPASDSGAPPPPPAADNSAPPPPPPPGDSMSEPPAPPAGDSAKVSPAPPPPAPEAAPPPPPPPAASAPPPAPGGGASEAPSDESKALDQLLNQ